MRSAHCILAGLAGSILLGLTGCGPCYDPLERYGLYTPMHVNHANLVASVANPADLVHGASEPASDGNLAVAAVTRLETNKLKKLPASSLTTIAVTTGGSSE